MGLLKLYIEPHYFVLKNILFFTQNNKIFKSQHHNIILITIRGFLSITGLVQINLMINVRLNAVKYNILLTHT